MNYTLRRERAAEAMAEDSILILYSGIPSHISADAYYMFEENKHFFYLTGLRRDHMILFMKKIGGKVETQLFIEAVDETAERWTGKMVKADEAKAISGIEDVRYTDRFEPVLNRLLSETDVNAAYFDTYRESAEDLPDYNAVMAKRFADSYPGIQIRNLWPIVTRLRMQKDCDEAAELRAAIDVTDQALLNVLRHLRPGRKEYQAQADFEYTVRFLGAEGVSFPTIAGSGKNGTMLHYETNRETMEDGTLLLMDLGARVNGYCADITRTYPVNGHFTERQRQVYDIVLRANRAIAKAAKPGVTTKELNELCKKILAEGCIELGLINDASEIGKYYMHSVSHHLGIDVHDVVIAGEPLKPGAVISDEPGLYIDEWAIGIRIEDDLLITEDGCEVLSENVIRGAEEIEAYMAEHGEE